ncbi:MAG: hypothetical protein M3R72_00725 [Bacteroidota bacterium]|nr:hypothetical protein [Bacteroidota bacterium]
MKQLWMFGFILFLATMVLNSCQKELSQENNNNTASFSLHDTTLSCYPILVNGTYYDGVSAPRDTNFIKVVVNVKTPGNYTISSVQQNGFYFSDSGFFSKTGIDTLVLKAKGTPILIQSTSFTITADSLGACSFVINVQDSTGTGLGSAGGGTVGSDSSYIDPNLATKNTWHFTDTATKITYSGIFTTVEGAGFRNDTLFVAGQAATNLDTLFGMTIKMPSATITPGIYPATAANNVALQKTADGSDIYYANDATAALGTGNSYITIISNSGGQLTGSFHVYASFNGVSPPTLIEGSFNCPVH